MLKYKAKFLHVKQLYWDIIDGQRTETIQYAQFGMFGQVPTPVMLSCHHNQSNSRLQRLPGFPCLRSSPWFYGKEATEGKILHELANAWSLWKLDSWKQRGETPLPGGEVGEARRCWSEDTDCIHVEGTSSRDQRTARPLWWLMSCCALGSTTHIHSHVRRWPCYWASLQ